MRNEGYTQRRGYTRPENGDLFDAYAGADTALRDEIGRFLFANYAGHPFRAEVSHQQGVVLIWIPELMGEVNKRVVHIRRLDPKLKAIDDACGEILERYKLPRANFTPADFLAAMARKPLHMRRHALVPE